MRSSMIAVPMAMALVAAADGSAQTPFLVRDVNTTSGQSEDAPDDLVAGSAALFFTAYDPVNGRELHRFSPGRGIDLLLDAAPGSDSLENPVFSAAAGPSAYYLSGRRLFASDGTPAGTRLVHTFDGPNPFPSDPVAV